MQHSSEDIPRRIIEAWSAGAQGDLIAQARIVDGWLYVQSCDLAVLTIPIADIPVLRRLEGEQLERMEIDQDGSFLFWPEPDIHLDLDALRFIADPAARQQALREKLRRTQRLGLAVQSLRKEAGLTQAEIAGLSERQVRRIEKGQFTPRIG